MILPTVEEKSILQEVFLPILQQKKVKLFIQRDDLIHPTISGNKWRKLKYNILQLKGEKKEGILTFGGAFSNHIAAVAVAGSKFNFKTVGIIRGDEHENLNPTLAQAKADGMEFRFVSREDYKKRDDQGFINELLDDFPNYLYVPEGGSNLLGLKGCTEILDHNTPFDYVTCASGTGATLAGIIASSKPSQRIIGFSALKGDFLYRDVSEFLKSLNYSASNWEMNNDYHFGGYAKINEELISFIQGFWSKTKIKLDPIYTGKMLYGVMDLIENDFFPINSEVLAIHTGGLQGAKGIELRYQVQFFKS